MLNFKKNGTFVEIGSNHPKINNNTFLLEKKYNWNGILIEYSKNFEKLYKEFDRTNYVIEDAVNIDYKKLFKKYEMPCNIDYLQIDLEVNNGSTINVLSNFDNNIFDSYKFATITFEHDMYRENNEYNNTRDLSRKIFEKHGYMRIFGDVNQEYNIIFEDWYIHPDLIDKEIYTKVLELNKHNYRYRNNRILLNNNPWTWSDSNYTYSTNTINYKDIIYN
tara:strand:+ start:5437 stop:6096 length:660 start_codon:yes stop_codon:yes gene_type:complete